MHSLIVSHECLRNAKLLVQDELAIGQVSPPEALQISLVCHSVDYQVRIHSLCNDVVYLRIDQLF